VDKQVLEEVMARLEAARNNSNRTIVEVRPTSVGGFFRFMGGVVSTAYHAGKNVFT
jgi:hypothetical protein